MRSFLAVPADPGWIESGRELVSRLSPALPRASWTRPASWHLTLKFLGEIDEAAATRFSDAIGPAIAATAEGVLASAGTMRLPPAGRPRVLGVGFAPGPALQALGSIAAAAERAAVSIGVAPDDRPFRPHLTLARVRDPWPPPAVEAFRAGVDRWVFPPWPARSCILYRSRLDPAGAVHIPLREWQLSALAVGARG